MGETPSPGRLVVRFSSVNASPGGNGAPGHDALAGNGLVFRLAGRHMLAAVAQSLLRIAHRAHHGRKLRRVQAGFVVRPFQRFVQGKVLFNDARAKRHGRDVGLPAQRVVGIPHRAAEMGRQVLHGAQGSRPRMAWDIRYCSAAA